MPQETTTNEILEAINDFANNTEERFNKIDGRFDKVEDRLGKVESGMVTKDYLDDKLGDLKGDLILIIRKEDTKLAALVEILKERNIINDDDIKKILAMEPFPHTL